MLGRKSVGPFRLPQEPLAREPPAPARKAGLGDSRRVLARRAKKHLRDVAAGRVVVQDLDSEVRQLPRSPQAVPVKRLFTVEDDQDDNED
jgi:hypothetical protein